MARTEQPVNDCVDVTLRVRYAETDQMGVAYYGNHFVWFEVGRTELFCQRGYVYKDLEEQEGCFIIVAEAHCRYHSPARYDEVLTVRTRVKEARTRVVFSYEILGPTAAAWPPARPCTSSPTARASPAACLNGTGKLY